MEVDPITLGSRQMTVSSATAVFPTDGVGGSSASVDSRFPPLGSYFIEACSVITGSTAGVLTVMQGDGATAFLTLQIPATATPGLYFPIGGLNGFESSRQGMSAKLSAGSVTLWFRRVG